MVNFGRKLVFTTYQSDGSEKERVEVTADIVAMNGIAAGSMGSSDIFHSQTENGVTIVLDMLLPSHYRSHRYKYPLGTANTEAELKAHQRKLHSYFNINKLQTTRRDS